MAMSDVSIAEEKGMLVVRVPYYPKFPPHARMLGGRWLAGQRVWTFDTRDRDRVIGLLSEIFGYGDTEFVDVEFPIDSAAQSGVSSIWRFGRELVCRSNRDSQPVLGRGVTLLSGGFERSGGSRNNIRIAAVEGTVLLVRDVPKSLVVE